MKASRKILQKDDDTNGSLADGWVADALVTIGQTQGFGK